MATRTAITTQRLAAWWAALIEERVEVVLDALVVCRAQCLTEHLELATGLVGFLSTLCQRKEREATVLGKKLLGYFNLAPASNP